jgi:hypothetical protein
MKLTMMDVLGRVAYFALGFVSAVATIFIVVL